VFQVVLLTVQRIDFGGINIKPNDWIPRKPKSPKQRQADIAKPNYADNG
jgi:hypothetical protein